jgi:DNA-binding SARP family transcriptional activator/tetratricopeptide (TPR) repeat protein
MRFGILGPLLVDDGESVVSVSAGRQRVLLAALLVHAGQAVRAETLADVVWDGSPPPGAIDTLRTHVMRLRRVLGPRAGARLVTRYPGYLVDASEDEVDLLRFNRLCRDGGAAVRTGSWAEAAQILSEALALWRGAALADVSSQILQRDEVPRLDELRVQAQEWRIDADLHLGRHADLVPEVQLLAAEHPLRERFHGELMLALYRCGRQAEALAAYRRARAVLIEELGAEPGSELRELHQQILTADPALATPEPEGRAAGGPSLIPRQLPGPVPQFIGRDQELAALTQLLEHAAHAAPATVVISAIGGTAGVGKTALAVHWAHQVADRFPDGQLHVNLRGYDPDQPVTAADALAGFLRALGVEGQDIPAEKDERAARYRSLLVGRRMLVVLDNAGSAEHVRPLLPGTPACMVVVTSRDALTGLVARDGATRLDLDLLPSADAVRLLRTLIGSRANADPAAATELATRCARLPLALRVAAELAVTRPAASLADLASELADGQRGLNLLDAGGDPRTAVRAVFSWSYRHLDADATRAFRLIGMHPGADLEPYAAAMLIGTTVEQATQMLNLLARAHLIQPGAPGRYAMHDLLRAYARELAAVHDGEDGQHASLTRLFDHYLQTAASAMDTLVPAERHRRPRIPLPDAPRQPMTEASVAREWLDAETANLIAVATHTARLGWPTYAIRLAATLSRYFEMSGRYSEAIIIHGHAREASLQTGDRAAEATALTNLGAIRYQQGRYEQGATHLQQALAVFRETGNRDGEARALGNLAVIGQQQGRYEQAATYHEQALAVFREIGNRDGEASALGNLGAIGQQQGRYQQAVIHHQQALALFRESGNRDGEALALGSLGATYCQQGRYQEATGHLQEALALFRESGNRYREAHTLADLGIVDQQQGRYRQATEYHQQALTMCREIGDRNGEAIALNGLGEVFLSAGRSHDARVQHTTALSVAQDIGYKHEAARAHKGLGHAWEAAGEHGEARAHWEQALAIYAELGAPEVEEIRARLAAPGEHQLADS